MNTYDPPSSADPGAGAGATGAEITRLSAAVVRKNAATSSIPSSSSSVSGATALSPEAAAAIHDDLQYEKLRKNFEVLTAEMASVQAATTTMDSCTRIIQFVESRDEPLAPGAAANRPDPWVDAGGGCCVIS